MTDQNRKTLRSFYCLDALWSTFEQQTHEFGVSMDYLINESMRQYAESQGFGVNQGFNQSAGPTQTHNPSSFPRVSGPNLNPSPNLARPNIAPNLNPNSSNMPPAGQNISQPPSASPSMNSMGSVTNIPNPNLGPNPGMRGFPPGPNTQGPRLGGPHKHAPQRNHPHNPAPQPTINSPNFVNPTFQQNFDPPSPQRPNDPFGVPNNGWPPAQRPGFAGPMQAPPQPPRPHTQTSGIPPLYLYFDNNRYTIGTEDFVIGRGSQRTDLTIRDGNISRRHCAILHRNGSHYIKDLGSTNGVEFQGNRIESKKISEGDVYYLCDYELRFSYQ